MVLIGLLYKYICYNITTQEIPNHVVYVYKEDLLNIKLIDFRYGNIRGINLTNSSINLSNLEHLCKFSSIQISNLYFNFITGLYLRCNQFE